MSTHGKNTQSKRFDVLAFLALFLLICTASFFACNGSKPSTEHSHEHIHHHDDAATHDNHAHGDTHSHADAAHDGGVHDHGSHDSVAHDHGSHDSVAHDHGSHDAHHEAHADHHSADPVSHLFLFNSDTKNNKWLIQVYHPTKGLVKTIEVPELALRTAKKAKDTKTDDAGPGWGDVVASADHKRLFANGLNADALVVVNVEKMEVEKIIEFGFGDRPVHNYLPNHGTEAWIHLDGKGSFYVIDTQTLKPISDLSNLMSCTSIGTGHGKLAYDEDLGTKYFCTNTSEPAGFAIDGKAKKLLKKFEICGVKPVDDPKTPEDESKGPLKGGTHDKAYLPGSKLIVFECTGGAGYTFVDPDKMSVVQDKANMSGSIAYSPGNLYVLAINASATEKQIQVWDKNDAQKNGYEFDFTLDVDGSPSARGTHFRKEGDDWQAWIPQTSGTKVAVANLATKKVQLVEVGKLSAPPNASHFSRRGAVGTGGFYTYTDEGLVKVDYATMKSAKMTGAVQGVINRLVFATPHSH